MLTKRLEILFDPKEFEAVKKKAEAEGKSIAGMIRETLREKIIESDSKRKERALKRLFSPDMETDIDEWSKEKKRIAKTRVKKIENSLILI